jgi:hypothetical protein
MQLGIGSLACAEEFEQRYKRVVASCCCCWRVCKWKAPRVGAADRRVNKCQGLCSALRRMDLGAERQIKSNHTLRWLHCRTLARALLLLADCSPTALRMDWPAALHSRTQRASPFASRRPSKRSPALREPANMMLVSLGCVAFGVTSHCRAAHNHKSRSDAAQHLRRRTLLGR